MVYKRLIDVKSAIIFTSGKVLMTGGLSREAITQGFIILQKKFRQGEWQEIKQEEVKIEDRGQERLNEFIRHCKEKR